MKLVIIVGLMALSTSIFAINYNRGQIKVQGEQIRHFSLNEPIFDKAFEGQFERAERMMMLQKEAKKDVCLKSAVQFAQKLQSNDVFAEFFILPSLTIAFDKTQVEGFTRVNFEFNKLQNESGIEFRIIVDNRENQIIEIASIEIPVTLDEDAEGKSKESCSFEGVDVQIRRNLMGQIRSHRAQ